VRTAASELLHTVAGILMQSTGLQQLFAEEISFEFYKADVEDCM
jgi:hypothetical protein